MNYISILQFAAMLGVYYIAAKLGTIFNIPPGFATALSPSAGVALTILLLQGLVYWPIVFLGAILFLFSGLTAIFHNLTLVNLISANLILAVSITLQALLGAFFIKKIFKENLALSNSKEIIKFLIFSGPVSCLVSAGTGATLLIVYNQVEVSDVLIQFFIWWFGQCFGVFMISPVLLAMFAKPKNIWKKRQNLIIWPMTIAFVALIIGFNFFKQLEVNRIKGAFEKQIETIHQLLKRELYHYIDVLYALESFYASSVEVDRKEFKLFTSYYLNKFSGLKSLQWIPKITKEDRSNFEEKLRQDMALNEFHIFEFNQNGDRKISPEKEEYFPIDFVEPIQKDNKFIGFDISSQLNYSETIIKAKDLGTPMATTAFNFEKTISNQNLWVFLPIYKNNVPRNSMDQRRKNLNGFIVAEFMVKEIIQTVTSKFESRKFILEAYDITRLQPKDLVQIENITNYLHTEKKVFKEYHRLKVIRFFDFAGRRWEVNYMPTENYIQEEQSWNLWIVLIGAVGFTSFLSIFLLIISGRTMEIEEQVKEKTEELKIREERFDLAIQGSSDGLWDWVNLEKDDQWWSPRFYELIGYKANEIKSSQSLFMGLIYPEDRKKIIDSRLNHFEKGEAYQVEFRLLHKSGQYRWFRVVGKAYKNDQGLFVRMAGSLVDITDDKAIELALKEEKHKASNLAATAQSAVKLKQEFLANVTHEIRSPMNSILGFASLLAETTLDDKQRNYLETIQSSGKNLLDIMNDLFDFSRMEKGQIRLEFIEFDIEYLLNNLVHLVSLKLKELPISTYVNINPNVPRKLLGDATRIRQILTHLLNNAVKFTRQGEIGVHVSMAQDSQGDDINLQFCVRDTGVGIPREKQAAIFESFSYAESSSQRQTEGLGLGLAICKKMIETMGGKITVESEQGKGSEFIFTLSLKKSLMSNMPATWLMKEELKNKKIFIFDNNRKSQEIIYQYCRELGLDVVGLADFAKGALNKIDDLCQSGNIPEVILCELLMSGMEPEDFVKKIKSQPLCHSVKLVNITSNAQPGSARYVKEIGFDAYLSKPVSKDDIGSILRVLLSQQTSEGIFITRHLVNEMSCKGVRILVAEDNQADLDLIKVFFQNLECEGDFVANGQEVIEKLKQNSYDLCLMDVHMPIMDGLTATQIIRYDMKNYIPIVALTIYATREEQERCLQGGMNYFLTKPLDIAQLREAIVRYGKKKLI